ncbi:MAG TPA: recombinase family protein [Symbiobacteriaceae bacterium]
MQREACRHFILSQDWTFREDLVFVDDGFSGGTLERPALTDLRRRVAAGEVQAVVVLKIDRLSRSVIDTVNLVLKDWEGRCFVKSAREPIDTTTPAGKMFFYMLVSYAEWERSVIRERTLSGKRKRAEQGRNAGQRYPFGYRRGEAGGWMLDAWDDAAQRFTGPAAVVQRIFGRFLAGVGMPAIAAELNRDGLPTPEGKAWRASHVGRIIENPAYCGTYVYGMRRGGSRRKQPPLCRVDGAMAAIVPVAEWTRVQELRAERAAHRTKARGGGYLLSSLAVCGGCGSPLCGSRGATRRYYVCTGLGPCDCGYIEADGLEQAVLAEVRAVAAAPPGRSLGRVAGELAAQVLQQERAVTQAAAEMAQAGRRRQRLEEQFLDGGLDAGHFQSLLQRLEGEAGLAGDRLRRAEAALLAARAAAGRLTGPGVGLDPGLGPGFDPGLDPWLHLAFDERKQLLRELVAELKIFQPKHRPGSKRGNPHPVRIDWTPRSGPHTDRDRVP